MYTRLLLMLLILGLPTVSHAALVERLMGIDGYEKIAVHTFFALNNERIHGRQTRAQVIAALGLSGEDITEYDALAALAPTGTTALAEAQKSLFLGSVHSIFLLAEERVTGYTTPSEVRAKLGL